MLDWYNAASVLPVHGTCYPVKLYAGIAVPCVISSDGDPITQRQEYMYVYML